MNTAPEKNNFNPALRRALRSGQVSEELNRQRDIRTDAYIYAAASLRESQRPPESLLKRFGDTNKRVSSIAWFNEARSTTFYYFPEHGLAANPWRSSPDLAIWARGHILGQRYKNLLDARMKKSVDLAKKL